MLYYYTRYVAMNAIKPNASLAPLDNRPVRQYNNKEGILDNALADDASQRSATPTLLANLYASITNYFLEKVWDSKPEGSVVNSNFIEEFTKATFYRSLYGYGVVMYVNGSWECIDSRYWWPVLQRGIKVGSALVIPYADDDSNFYNAQGSQLGASVPNKARTTLILDTASRGVIRDFEYSGISLGRQLSSEDITDIKIVIFGNGIKDYDLAEPLILKYNDLLVSSSDIIDRFSKPHMQVPASAITYDANKNPVLTLDKEGSVLPVNNTDKDWKYLTLEANVNVFEFQARQLLGMISAITSVPMASFNIHGLPRLESGEGVQALEAPANSKVQMWRQSIVEAVQLAGFQISWELELETTNNESEDDGQSSEDTGT